MCYLNFCHRDKYVREIVQKKKDFFFSVLEVSVLSLGSVSGPVVKQSIMA
jgi:hypothetical protein